MTGISILPLLLHWNAPPPDPRSTHIAIDCAYVAVVILCWVFYRVELRRSTMTQAGVAVFLIFVLAMLVNGVHHFAVDTASSYIAGIPNEKLQEDLQERVVQLSPAAIPHSYRFLPNALVFWLQLAGVRFDAARDIYRSLCMLAIFYALFRFARLFTDYLGSIVALLLVAAVYPMTFQWYIGQLTDPLSQLCFVLAFICLGTDSFLLLLTTILIGSLAKETVLALCVFYPFRGSTDTHRMRNTAVLCTCCATMYLIGRWFVLHGPLQYQQISAPGENHILENWRDSKWRYLFLLTGGVYIPFLIASWRTTPVLLKRLAIFLLAILFCSSLLFSWLSEARNWMPLVFVLAVIAGRYISASRSLG